MKDMKASRYIVTGGAGFIGSAVARLLLRDPHREVLVIDKLTYAGTRDSLREIWDESRFRFLRADICDGAAMLEAFRAFLPDVVMHLAAESHVDRSIDGPAAFVETNIGGTFVLLQAALQYLETVKGTARDWFRFHHISTDEVFGSLGADASFTEDSNYRPNSPYAATKAASDHLVRAWHRTYGLPIVLSNCSNNFGPFQFPEKLMPTVILNALAGCSIPVYGQGKNVRDWLYVEDHAEALMMVAEQGHPGESYNIGANCERTNLEVVRQICAVLDDLAPRPGGKTHDQLIEFVTDRPGHDFRYAIDATRIRRELGWSPRETFETGVRKTVMWYLDNRAWWDGVRSQAYAGERLGLALGKRNDR